MDKRSLQGRVSPLSVAQVKASKAYPQTWSSPGNNSEGEGEMEETDRASPPWAVEAEVETRKGSHLAWASLPLAVAAVAESSRSSPQAWASPLSAVPGSTVSPPSAAPRSMASLGKTPEAAEVAGKVAQALASLPRGLSGEVEAAGKVSPRAWVSLPGKASRAMAAAGQMRGDK